MKKACILKKRMIEYFCSQKENEEREVKNDCFKKYG